MLKFSAIEIYNEVIRDLLSAENTPLRLWDDAEVKKGLLIILDNYYPAMYLLLTLLCYLFNRRAPM